MGEPRVTTWPAPTEWSTGSYVVRRPSAWSMLTNGRPATIPANATTPSPAARTGAPAGPWRSTPRCPGAYVCGGASNGRPTGNGPASGAVHSATWSRGLSGAAVAGAGGRAAASRTISSTAARRACTDESSARPHAERWPAGRLWNRWNAGETAPRPRVCCPVRPEPMGRLRASSSRRIRRGSRHLGPGGQPPGVWRSRTPGRRTTRCPRQPRSAAAGRAHRERRPWQSSA